jgi:hypothetical protein
VYIRSAGYIGSIIDLPDSRGSSYGLTAIAPAIVISPPPQKEALTQITIPHGSILRTLLKWPLPIENSSWTIGCERRFSLLT